jgi:nucleotide-binding universal stress UspA family protein
MLPEIKKILFTSDLTETSKFAFSYAASLAGRYCARMVFLYVMEEVPHSAKGFLDQEILDQIRRHALDNATHTLVGKRRDMARIQSELEKFCEFSQDRQQNGGQAVFASEVVVTEGNVVDEILKTAQDHECDTIVMGSARHGALSEVVRGSVVKGVLRRSDRMVVVAPPLPKKE